MKHDLEPLRLGADVVRRLLPHRRPFCMVDAVTAYRGAPKPSLAAERHISANEPIFDGHFPGLHLWPGAYTIEGLGQSCHLLHLIASLEAHWQAEGHDPNALLEALRNLELGTRLHPGYRPERSRGLLAALQGEGMRHVGMMAGVELKLLGPVFAGQRLDYLVTRTHVIGQAFRFEVEAFVEGELVAQGVLRSVGRKLPDDVARP